MYEIAYQLFYLPIIVGNIAKKHLDNEYFLPIKETKTFQINSETHDQCAEFAQVSYMRLTDLFRTSFKWLYIAT